MQIWVIQLKLGTSGIQSLKGIIHLHLGNKDKGYRILTEQVNKNDPYIYMKIDHYLEPYRKEDRFIELLKVYGYK